MENYELCSGIKIKWLMIYSKGLLSFVGEGIFLEMDKIVPYYDPLANLLYLDTIKSFSAGKKILGVALDV